jgi:acyl-CoA synthetase (AMP-forming)/AMP-acid ligase II
MFNLALPEQLKLTATQYPGLGVSIVHDDGSISGFTYQELLHTAKSIAKGLISKGLSKGDKVIAATDNNKDTIELVWGCFLAGLVPTILQPPMTFNDFNPAAVKLLNVFHQLNEPPIVTSVRLITSDEGVNRKNLIFDEIPRINGDFSVEADFDDLAFIQYSSGSTGEPKGIMLSHRNLARNIEAIIEGIDLQPEDRGGNWMPLYHDMGLIGYHLTPVYCPCQQYHIETVDFIKNPGLWLDMINEYRITVTGCPNFGQALVVRYLKRRSEGKKWDFTTVKALLNGAEPISVRILDEFSRNMKSFGFRDEAMMPVYGMAEATLALTFAPLLETPVITTFDGEIMDKKLMAVRNMTSMQKSSRAIISVGKPIRYVDLRIVNEAGEELTEGMIGHIQVKGESITKGYYLQAEATSAIFNGDWLKTGDLGFISGGNLYISGRFKDIIFMNGRNYFAHDLENLACTIEGISYGKIIFGGITDTKTSKEKVLAFVAGTPETKAVETLTQLRALLRKKLGIHLDELILIRSNEIPKTSSGKIQRYRLIQRYQQGEFKDNRIK